MSDEKYPVEKKIKNEINPANSFGYNNKLSTIKTVVVQQRLIVIIRHSVIRDLMDILINNSNEDHCFKETDIIEEEPLLTFFGILSVLSYLYICNLYFVVKLPALQRHPTSMFLSSILNNHLHVIF